MQIIALEHERRALPADSAESILRAEARALWILRQEGFVRAAYFRADRKEAVLILEGESVDESQARLNRLPLVREGFIEFELIPLVPYDGFARLFER